MEGIDSERESRDETVPIHSLTLRAEVILLADRGQRSAVAPLVPDQLPVQWFRTVDAFLLEVSSNVAVVLVSTQFDDEQIATVVKRTLSTSEHARIALVAADAAELLRCEVPHDESFVLPDEQDSLAEAIKRLYVRAYYSVTTERYYKLSLAIKNSEMQPGDGNDGKLEQVKRTHERTKQYLQYFRHFLDQDDFDAMKTREHRYHELLDSKDGVDPSAFNLPDSCPDCTLDWTTWHGPRLRIGYEQIGANTWRCTRCSHLIADNDPEEYKIG